ncbi:MAG: hypothetical protein N3B13_09760, partial [Deltaproteobacteria bacterium]|nr:hypothetical protein [Deltaproteobacteria bacterium]
MRCPGCGIEIENPGKFCGSCGAKLTQKICPNGHIMNDTDETCPHCATQRQQKVKTVAPENKGKTLFEINTIAPVSKQQGEMKEFTFDRSPPPVTNVPEIRKTKVVKTDGVIT